MSSTSRFTWFAAWDDIPRAVIAGKSGQSVGRLVQVDTFQRQILTVRDERTGRNVADDSSFDHRYDTRRCYIDRNRCYIKD